MIVIFLMFTMLVKLRLLGSSIDLTAICLKRIVYVFY
jgi:hypothetical protein